MTLEELSKKLKARGFIPEICGSGKEAAEKILSIIPAADSVGKGGSVTLSQIGIAEKLAERGNTFFDRNSYVEAAGAKWFLSSANAMTENGDIVNIDGSANRVSSLIFGVPNVIYVVGKNKIVKDLDAAIDRIRNYTCHLNAVRLGKSTPCAITGKCAYCTGKECMCNVTTIVHHPTRYQEKVYVLLIDEELGY